MARKNRNAGAAPLTSPQTREERYLANIAGLEATKPAYPFTRTERYLDAITSSTSGLADRVTALETGKLDVIGKGVNLLDNAYFIGGGTAGKFPVNQKGATSYNAAGAICIDRWILNQNTLFLTAAGLKSNTGSLLNLIQYFEDERIDDGQTYTLSVLTDTGCVSISAVLDKSATPSSGWQMSTPSGKDVWAGLRHEPAGSTGKWHLRLSAASDSTVIKAIKLELGTQQTLAHQVNGSWVLNDPAPNYAEELAKCQRYLVEINPYGDEYGSAGYAIAVNSTKIRTKLQLPVTPRTVSSIETAGSWVFQDYTGGTALSPSGTPSGIRTVGNGVTFDWTVSGATAGRVYLLQANNDTTARMRVISSF